MTTWLGRAGFGVAPNTTVGALVTLIVRVVVALAPSESVTRSAIVTMPAASKTCPTVGMLPASVS